LARVLKSIDVRRLLFRELFGFLGTETLDLGLTGDGDRRLLSVGVAGEGERRFGNDEVSETE
jgi:hypothetical protein